MSDSPITDHLRLWNPTQEDYDAAYNYTIDAREAWLHLEPLWTSLGYSVLYGDENDCPPRRPLVDQAAAGDSFHPSPSRPLVHSITEQYDMFVKKRGAGWLMKRPRLTYAYDKLNRLVVIKALEPKSSEMDIIKYLNSPELRASPSNHTIPILEQVNAEGWEFLIMPAWNITCAPFFVWQVDDYFKMIIQSFEGLAFMHQHGVAHRDISAGNVVFDHDATCDVFQWDVFPIISTWDARLAFIDFGISKRFSLDTDPSTWVTSEWSGPGDNMAPEVAANEHGPSEYQVLPADVYSLASIWHQRIDWEKRITAAFERRPELRTKEVSIYAHQLLEKHLLGFTQLLGEALDPDPAKRPTASDLATKFREMRETIPAEIRFAPDSGYSADLV